MCRRLCSLMRSIKKWTLTERLHCSHSKAPSGTWSSLPCTVHTACCLLLPQGHSWHGRRCSQLHNKKQGQGHNLEKKTKTLTIEPECHHCLPLKTNMKVPICIFIIQKFHIILCVQSLHPLAWDTAYTSFFHVRLIVNSKLTICTNVSVGGFPVFSWLLTDWQPFAPLTLRARLQPL